MGAFIQNVQYVTVTCDLCRSSVHRSHEPTTSCGDMGERIRKELPKVDANLPSRWAKTGTDQYICGDCVKRVFEARGQKVR